MTSNDSTEKTYGPSQGRGGIDRRQFLRDSGIAAGALFAASLVAPREASASTSASLPESDPSRVLPPRTRYGLHVRPDGTLTLRGEPFYGIGVNFFDAFYRTLTTPLNASYGPGNTTYLKGFQVLAGCGIPFARFMACGYWPIEMKAYVTDKELYFSGMDGVVAAAERYEVGLIPSMFWATFCVPDIVGEPLDQWGNPASATIAFMKQYVHDVISRYHGSPAIFGWEFGNEYDLAADLLQYAAANRPPVEPQLGTPTQRTAQDDLTHGEVRTALTEFASAVRSLDGSRMISSGNAFPRATEWHQWKEATFSTDSEPEYAVMLTSEDNPDPIDTISVHNYDTTNDRFGQQIPWADFLELSVRIAKVARKPLFLGEFGSNQATGAAQAETTFDELLSGIQSSDIQAAALWVFDFTGQATTFDVTNTNARAYQLQAIAAANKRLHQRRGVAPSHRALPSDQPDRPG